MADLARIQDTKKQQEGNYSYLHMIWKRVFRYQSNKLKQKSYNNGKLSNKEQLNKGKS